MNRFLAFFLPKDRVFYTLFEKACDNLCLGAVALQEAMCNELKDGRLEKFRLIGQIEHNGDELTHEIFDELSRNYITPFGRDDVHRLASALDDVLDHIHGCAKRMERYNIPPNKDTQKLADLIVLSTQELNGAIKELRTMKDMHKVIDACVRINNIENEADNLFDKAVAYLFDTETNAIQIIKVKEILQSLEMATDMCEDAANVIESIIVKYA